MAHILAVDDEPLALRFLTGILVPEHQVTVCTGGARAMAELTKRRYDLVLADLNMPPPDGFEVLRHAQRMSPPVPVVVISANDRARAVIEAIRLGARDFIMKPATAEEIQSVLARIGATPGADSDAALPDFGFVGRSPAIREVRQLLALLARSPENVLVHGETGTGKELVACALHEHSSRRAGPFVAHNMAATPSELAESMFFGHLRGTFSGATADRAGLFEQADGGTLFLDEIDSFPMALQAKLLRVLECGSIQRIGSGTEVRLDVRVIAASATDLCDRVARGAFRADLFYRLNQLQISLPSLRERHEDIPALVAQFMAELAGPQRPSEVSPAAMELLLAHGWPGNCRELRHAVRRAALVAAGGPILPGHLSGWVPAGAPALRAGSNEDLKTFEHQHILEVLERSGGNRSRAARLLGVDRGTLAKKLKTWSLPGGLPGRAAEESDLGG